MGGVSSFSQTIGFGHFHRGKGARANLLGKMTGELLGSPMCHVDILNAALMQKGVACAALCATGYFVIGHDDISDNGALEATIAGCGFGGREDSDVALTLQK